jgi:hypothetical protein
MTLDITWNGLCSMFVTFSYFENLEQTKVLCVMDITTCHIIGDRHIINERMQSLWLVT